MSSNLLTTVILAVFLSVAVLKSIQAVPTSLQLVLQDDDAVETTTQGYYIEDTEILEDKSSNSGAAVAEVQDDVPAVTATSDPDPANGSGDSSLSNAPHNFFFGSQEVAIAEKVDANDEADDEEAEGGDDEEEEEGPPGGFGPGGPGGFGPGGPGGFGLGGPGGFGLGGPGPFPGPPRPRPNLAILKPGSLYKLPANSTSPERIPPISAAQQQQEKDATSTTTDAPSTTPKSRIRTTSIPKSTTAKSTFIRRKPSTPKPAKTTTQKALSFAEEFNLTNFFHTHTGPQGRADCECGKVPFKIENADAAGVNIYPWAVAIVRSGIFGGGRPHCGGTLVNDRFVVTAVHCVLDLYADDIQVWLTAHNSFQPIDNFVQSDRIVKRNVAEILMHPNYNRISHDNDIALLRLANHVDISASSFFTPICLAAADNSYAGLTARVVGWSSSSGSNRFSSHKLCKDDVPVIANDVCIRDTVHGSKVTNNMMCAGLLTPDRSQECLGDAGSGLTIPNGGRYTLIGVVSWGYASRQPYSPVVYAKVSGYSDWILHNTRDADWCIV